MTAKFSELAAQIFHLSTIKNTAHPNPRLDFGEQRPTYLIQGYRIHQKVYTVIRPIQQVNDSLQYTVVRREQDLDLFIPNFNECVWRVLPRKRTKSSFSIHFLKFVDIAFCECVGAYSYDVVVIAVNTVDGEVH